MAEWLILLLLVPAIVVPVVLVFGFTGCHFTHGVVPPPKIDATEGTSFNTISVTWEVSDSPVSFRRTNPDGTTTPLGEKSASPFPNQVPRPTESVDLPPFVYQYQAQYSSEAADPNSWSPPVSGKTFELTFDGQLNSGSDQPNWEGTTLVQRIEKGFLTRNSDKVQIIVQASALSDAHVDRIYISQPDPNSQNPYDSLPTGPSGLTSVYDSQPPVIVAAGTYHAFVPVPYKVDITQPLLIAVDFTDMPTSGLGVGDPVDTTKVNAWISQNAPPEAKVASRSGGYLPILDAADPSKSYVIFIKSIYVFVG
jgi:hypothetical protein